MCNIFFCGLTAFRKMNGLVKTLGMKLGFESFVNSEECKTPQALARNSPWFESFVNSEECKTSQIVPLSLILFESFVNSEEYNKGRPVYRFLVS